LVDVTGGEVRDVASGLANLDCGILELVPRGRNIDTVLLEQVGTVEQRHGARVLGDAVDTVFGAECDLAPGPRDEVRFCCDAVLARGEILEAVLLPEARQCVVLDLSEVGSIACLQLAEEALVYAGV